MAGGWEGCLCVLMWEERAGVMSTLRVPARTQDEQRSKHNSGRSAGGVLPTALVLESCLGRLDTVVKYLDSNN